MTRLGMTLAASIGMIVTGFSQVSVAQAGPVQAGRYTNLPALPGGRGSPEVPEAHAEIVTGSLGRSLRLDLSAKGGNAEQPERAAPQLGSTAGGPAY